MESPKGALQMLLFATEKINICSFDLSSYPSLITSNDVVLETDFNKLLNQVWELSACDSVICAWG